MAARTAILMIVLTWNLLLPSEAGNCLQAGVASEDDAKAILNSEFEGKVSGDRVERIQELLRQTYTALPKYHAGNLGHQTKLAAWLIQDRTRVI